MHKFFLTLASLFVLSMATAQETIEFAVGQANTTDLSEKAQAALDARIMQILTRNSAAAGDNLSPYVIIPTLVLTDMAQSDGLVRNVTLAHGELTLVASNRFDGGDYHSVVVNLSADVTGDKEAAIMALIKSIKVTDPVYTRFVRVARSKIEKYLAQHPLPKNPDTVYVDRIVEKPINADPQETTDPTPKKKVVPAQITYSNDQIEIRILSCRGLPSQRCARIEMEIINKTGKNFNSRYYGILQAYDDKGHQFSDFHGGGNYSLPAGVPVRRSFAVLNVPDGMPKISFMELSFADTKIEIRNLEIDW